jgi:hypothetical protein
MDLCRAGLLARGPRRGSNGSGCQGDFAVGRDISESADVEFFRHSRMFNNSQNQISLATNSDSVSDAMTWKQIIMGRQNVDQASLL